jgi:IMP dehydrogenase
MKIRKEPALAFDDVLLVPKQFIGQSRKEVKLSTNIAGLELKLPIISANMPGVTGFEMAKVMAEAGGLGIIDRIDQHDPYLFAEWKSNNPGLKIGASVGIGDCDLVDADVLIELGVDLICIDVAHADQARVYSFFRSLRKSWPDQPVIIGNYAQPNQLMFGQNTAYKIGIGGGSVCTTRVQTGCGMPTFQSIVECNTKPDGSRRDIIADGGIKNSGDIVKSMAAGADAVMIGSLLAGTDEAPGQLISANGKNYKVYRGSASAGAKAGAGLTSEFIEGAESLVPAKGSAKKILKSLEDGIRSGMSYCGAMNLAELRRNAEFVVISQAGHKESLPHGTL